MPPKDETPEQVKEWLQTALRKIWPLAEVRIIQGQLLNQHRHQLSPTAESSRVPLGLEEITLPVFPSLLSEAVKKCTTVAGSVAPPGWLRYGWPQTQ